MASVNKRKALVVTILIVCSVLTLCFIFGNSLEGTAESSERSGRLLAFLKEALGLDFLTHNAVRKIAHVLEFALLGMFVEGFFLTVLRKGIRGLSLVFATFFGLVSGLIDETVQIFTDRGSQVADAWLDFSGVMLGAVFSLVLYGTFKHIAKKF